MSVKIHGKEYRTVAERVNLFHEKHKDAVKSVKTKICFTQENKVVMKATVIVGDSVYTGHAEEVYDSSMINKTSALENCETSAIGRALASAGFGGTEFASADEVANAISQQNKLEQSPAAHNSSSTNSNNGEDMSNYIHTEDMRDSLISFGKHKGERWRDLPSDYITWLSNNSDNDKWRMMAMGELTYRASTNIENRSSNPTKEDMNEEGFIPPSQREMQLSSEPSLENGDDDALPF
tara:strand:+ start:671 stop:1381 length:711 start_codon:yes stop_codon:yes gene_type:complete